jgi:molybdate transport system substrate-binding protein
MNSSRFQSAAPTARAPAAGVPWRRPPCLGLRLRRVASALLSLALLVVAPLACAAELTVSAATSLSQVFGELAGQFERAHPGTIVLLNSGASGALLQQLARGAPVDVFATADHETMDRAAAQGLISDAERHDFAANRLVVVVPAGSALQLASLSELEAAPVRRLALGIPSSVPAGRYAKQALEDAGVWEALERRVVGAQNARQALDYVARGEVEAGLVYATDAALMPGRVRQVLEVPTRTPVRYPIASTVAAREPALARAFVAFVRSPEAARILARHGFGRP